MNSDWLATEHHRLHIVENWPDGPRKDAALKAIRSALASLLQSARTGADIPVCEVCLNRKLYSGILEFRNTSQLCIEPTHLAA
jgi:hypothetical protein